MKTFKEALDELKNSKEFKDWKAKNQEAYLSYGFIILPKENSWKAGFYHPDNDNITTFTISNKITIEHEEPVFKPKQTHVNKLEISKVKITLKKALETAEKLQKQHYKSQTPVEKIILLQDIDKMGIIWNITYISKTLETLNIKISAQSGKVLEHKSIKLFEFKK